MLNTVSYDICVNVSVSRQVEDCLEIASSARESKWEIEKVPQWTRVMIKLYI